MEIYRQRRHHFPSAHACVECSPTAVRSGACVWHGGRTQSCQVRVRRETALTSHCGSPGEREAPPPPLRAAFFQLQKGADQSHPAPWGRYGSPVNQSSVQRESLSAMTTAPFQWLGRKLQNLTTWRPSETLSPQTQQVCAASENALPQRELCLPGSPALLTKATQPLCPPPSSVLFLSRRSRKKWPAGPSQGRVKA